MASLQWTFCESSSVHPYDRHDDPQVQKEKNQVLRFMIQQDCSPHQTELKMKMIHMGTAFTAGGFVPCPFTSAFAAVGAIIMYYLLFRHCDMAQPFRFRFLLAYHSKTTGELNRIWSFHTRNL